MTKVLDDVLAANQNYVEGFGDKGSLALPPARRFAILTCMDARLDPAKFAGLAEGDAHVIRNAGGRASDDAIRSLIISHKLLGTNEWFVIHHTDCGMETLRLNDVTKLVSALRRVLIEMTGATGGPQALREQCEVALVKAQLKPNAIRATFMKPFGKAKPKSK